MTLCAVALLLTSFNSSDSKPLYLDSNQPIESRVSDLLKRMTLEEKFNQLRCDQNLWEKTVTTSGFGETLDILRPLTNLEAAKRANEVQAMSKKSRLGIPVVIHDEALHGLIGNGTTSFPQSISMAATWDPSVVASVAGAIAEETRARGVRHVLSPVINVIRDARWGRVEETYGEDTLLTSRMGVAFVKEFEQRGIATTPKHFVVNAGDGGRDSHSINISERQLREIYLPPFEAVVKEGKASTIMSAYNSLNGEPCTSNHWLLTDILRKEWGFDGWVASDYGAVSGIRYQHRVSSSDKQTAALGINAGMESEWPGVSAWGKGLEEAVKEGLISKKTLDQAVGRVLRIKFRTGTFDEPFADPAHVEAIVQSPKHKQIALDAARKAITLLKNEGHILPFSKSVKRVAVIGPGAKDGIPLGGYSGFNTPSVSVVDGIRNVLGSRAEVEWTRGARFQSTGAMPVISGSVIRELKGAYYDNEELRGEPKVVRSEVQIAFNWGQNSPDPKLPRQHFSARYTGRLVPEMSGKYTVSLTSDDGVRLWLNGRLVINDWSIHPSKTDVAEIQVEAGKPIDLKLEYYQGEGEAVCELGWGRATGGDSDISAAVDLALRSDVAVIVATIIEGEAQDRAHLDLPGNQEELIQKVAATGKPVVVVLIAGSPVTMERWVHEVPAIMDAWYPGQQGGQAIAEAIFGDINPGGKLPITFPLNVGQVPIYYNMEPSGRGYDYVDLTGKPLFPFGFGLSYTNFEYSNLSVHQKPGAAKGVFSVSLRVKNVGKVAGDEVVQLYTHQSYASVVRPLKELKDFVRITLAPGEEKAVQFELTPAQLAIWNAKMKKVTEPGTYDVMVGSSSEDIRLRGELRQ